MILLSRVYGKLPIFTVVPRTVQKLPAMSHVDPEVRVLTLEKIIRVVPNPFGSVYHQHGY